jgi:hypothetical protein
MGAKKDGRSVGPLGVIGLGALLALALTRRRRGPNRKAASTVDVGAEEPRLRPFFLSMYASTLVVTAVLLFARFGAPVYSVPENARLSLAGFTTAAFFLTSLMRVSPIRQALYCVLAFCSVAWAFNTFYPWSASPASRLVAVTGWRWDSEAEAWGEFTPPSSWFDQNRIEWQINGQNEIWLDINLGVRLAEGEKLQLDIPFHGSLNCEASTSDSQGEGDSLEPDVRYYVRDGYKTAVVTIHGDVPEVDYAKSIKCRTELPSLLDGEGVSGVGRMRYQLDLMKSYPVPVDFDISGPPIPSLVSVVPDAAPGDHQERHFPPNANSEFYAVEVSLGALGRVSEYSGTIGLLALGALISDSWVRRRPKDSGGSPESADRTA